MLLLIIFVAVTVNFMIARLMPGDPVENAINRLVAAGGGSVGNVQEIAAAYRAELGLDESVWKQYLAYWVNVFQFDFGTSLVHYPARVSHIIWAALPWTIGLLGIATVISFSVGILLGAALGWPGTPKFVKALVPVFLLTAAVPYFLIGMVLIFFVVVTYRVFPSGGGYTFGSELRADWPTVQSVFMHAVLPALSIILSSIGSWALGMRGMLISTLGEDYITLAQARGLPKTRIFLWYGVRNSLLPQLTALAILLGHAVSGAVLVEVIFSYPGLGFRLFEAINGKDFFVVQGIVLILAISIAVAMFALDLLYPLIDPRIRYQSR
ncbi:MAG: ABC transporter permease [Chloroflexi bacterium]|nr:ABC transporter permease [Chloroflexota bacterium]